MVEAKKESSSEALAGQALKAKEDLHQLLQESKAANAATNLHDHIIAVLDKLIASCPDKALERFEEVSYLIKNKDTRCLEDFIKVNESRDYCIANEDVAKGTQESIDQVRALFEVSSQSLDIQDSY